MLFTTTHEFVDVRFAYMFKPNLLGKVFLSTFFLLGQRSLAGLVSEDQYQEDIQ